MAKACTRCFRSTPRGRCIPGCSHYRPPARAGGRGYSDTAEYRRVLAEVLERDGLICCYRGIDPECVGAIDDSPDSPDPLVLAHVIPHADGGPFTPDNLRPAHRSCNRRAGRQPVMEA